MPRTPRNLIIEEDFQVHKMWRCHNGEFNLESDAEKRAYLKYLNKLLPKQKNELNLYSLMSNHSHEVFDIKDKKRFSDLMRDHHSRYGRYYNDKHDRYGKVAYERPKTCLIESEEYSMRATFYVHANPLRAGLTKNAANYKWSTHRLYAFGKRDEYNLHVRFPVWYMELGRTWEERRRAYRRLFDAYLRELGLIKQDFLDRKFYGSFSWTKKLSDRLKSWTTSKAKDPP